MADRNMKVSVLVQLVDRLTAPLRAITRGIGAMANFVGDLGRRIGLIGGTLAALSFTGPIQAAAAWDTQLRDIAITAGKSGLAAESMIAGLSKQYQQLAFMTGQTSFDVAQGAKTLISGNMATELIEKLMPTIAKVATATGATITDTAKTVLSLSDTLKIPSEQMEASLGKLAVAGKLGRFEFADMARALPELTAQMAKLGITGLEAVESLGANLQIAMIGTADPSQAATNLNNFLTKINAPEAIKKFEKELKVDLTGVMTDATAKGINPVEAVIGKMISKLSPHQAEIDKIMKKAGASDKEREGQIKTLLAGTNVGKLYADMQVLGFILPMMQNLDKFKQFRDQLKTAGVATIVDDFATRMKGLQPQLNQFGVVAGAVGNRIGLAFASNLPTAMTALQDLLKSVEVIDKKWPGLIDGVLSWTGGLLALGVGIAVLTPVVSALAGVLGFLVSPIGMVAAAFAVAAVTIYRNWDRFGPYFTGLFEGLKQIGKGFVDWWGGLWNFDFARSANGVRSVMDGLGTVFSNGWNIIRDLFVLGIQGIDKLFGTDLANTLLKAGGDAIQGLWNGMMAKFDEMMAWIKAKIDPLKNMFNFNFGGAAAGVPGGQSVDPMGNPTGFNPTSAPGGVNGFSPRAPANSNMQVGGVIRVEAVEGTRVVNVESANPAVPLTPNRGTMLGRA